MEKMVHFQKLHIHCTKPKDTPFPNMNKESMGFVKDFIDLILADSTH